MLPKINGEICMNTYKIDVNVVAAAGTAAGKALAVSPQQMEVTLPSDTGIVEHALVTWTFRNLPAGTTPVIAFASPEVIASGPTTTLGAAPQVAFEIRFPPSVPRGPYSARYEISLSSALNKKLEELPPPVDGPYLVVVRNPDPPGGGVSAPVLSHAGA
jgi:hypothetical protein